MQIHIQVRYYHVDVTARYGNLSISRSASVYTTVAEGSQKERGVVYMLRSAGARTF